MDNLTFKSKVVVPLETWSCLGEKTNAMGNRLIGHVPHIAPKAYLHTIFAPTDSEEYNDFEHRLGRPVPSLLKRFLSLANGMGLFVDSIRIMGFVPYQKKFESHPYNYPSNILIPNSTARIKGLLEESVVVGWYKWDGSYASIEPGGQVVRFDARGHGGILQTWSDFDSWIMSEIVYYSQFFDKQGKMIGEGNWRFSRLIEQSQEAFRAEHNKLGELSMGDVRHLQMGMRLMSCPLMKKRAKNVNSCLVLPRKNLSLDLIRQ